MELKFSFSKMCLSHPLNLCKNSLVGCGNAAIGQRFGAFIPTMCNGVACVIPVDSDDFSAVLDISVAISVLTFQSSRLNT
jgi:hypothetical protein